MSAGEVTQLSERSTAEHPADAGANVGAPVLRIAGLSVAFQVGRAQLNAVEDVTIEVYAGQTVALVGESGSGKTTTASTVNRLLPENGVITAGAILLDGEDIAQLPESAMVRLRGAGIGLVPQDPMSNLNPLMRIGAQIAEALEVHGLSKGAKTTAKVVELLDMVGIPEPERRAKQFPHEFSGGMRQRALIAMGLACRPKLLIADEPTSALDVTVQRKVLDQFAELTGKLGTAVLLITHDLSLAAERADRIVVMYRGRVVEQGTASEVFANPRHDYTKQLLAAIPSLSSPTRAPVSAVAQSAPLVTVQGLTKVYPVRRAARDEPQTFTAVSEVTFDIPRAQTVSLVGESGSGKSTTANMILGLETITSGRVLFDGHDITKASRAELFAFRRRMQPVFQDPFASLDPRRSVAESIAEPLKVHGVHDKVKLATKVAQLLDDVALSQQMADRLPHELSGGQRQRVAIARALALEPELVVLDEPVSALDVLVQAQILELLAGLQTRHGLSYLFISHDLAVVRQISDYVYVMRRGEIVESGTPAELFAAPQHPYTQELLAAIPRH
ncbi:MAG: ABC transporter ATP-binding protein [Propionibacteriaceae bacterium]|jgi:peptide/nickel transport system ATP-binding protein|nr:ABC transporter ATP-binding protein [Propionibacteriaceae bacterium]